MPVLLTALLAMPDAHLGGSDSVMLLPAGTDTYEKWLF